MINSPEVTGIAAGKQRYFSEMPREEKIYTARGSQKPFASFNN